MDVVTAEASESVIFLHDVSKSFKVKRQVGYLSIGCFRILWIFEGDIVVGYEVEGTAAVVQVALKYQSGNPAHIAIQFHHCFLEDGSLPTTRHTRCSIWTGHSFSFRVVSSEVIEIRNGEHVASALDDHEVSRVFILSNAELHVVLPAHDKARTMTCDHVRIA